MAYRPLRIVDLPRGLQPREQLKAVGATNVADDVLIAIILRIGVPGLNAVEAARRLLVEFGSLEHLSKATVGEIVARKIPGIGETKALQVVAGLELGRRAVYQEHAMSKGSDVRIDTTQDIVAHNHPAGDPEPSEEDIGLTRKLIEAGKLLNIPVYDHVVIGRPTESHLGFFSIAASGLVKFD